MKGMIIAAGYGTRFLPFTKTIPKEMLPLINRPALDFIIEEFITSGISEILIITSRRKKCLEDYLDREMELEYVFNTEQKTAKLKQISPPAASFTFIRQPRMMGTGQALLLGKNFIGNSPCVVAYPDDIHLGSPPLARQLIDKYEATGCNVLATVHNPPDLNRFGVISLAADGLHIKNIIEKPPAGQEPSREASIGRFLYTPEFFHYLEEGWQQHPGGEYYHTTALQKLACDNKLVYHTLQGEWLDTGEPAGYLRTILKYAKTVPEFNRVLEEFF